MGRRAGAAGAPAGGALPEAIDRAGIRVVGAPAGTVGAADAESVGRAIGGTIGTIGGVGAAAKGSPLVSVRASADAPVVGELGGTLEGTLEGTLNGAAPTPRAGGAAPPAGGANRSSNVAPVALAEADGAAGTAGVGVRGARVAGGGGTSAERASGAPNAAGGTGIDAAGRDAGVGVVVNPVGADGTGDVGTNDGVGDWTGAGGCTGVTCAGVSGVGRAPGSAAATGAP